MKALKMLFGALVVGVVLFGFLPLVPALLHDAVLITWAAMPWWAQTTLIAALAAAAWIILRLIVKAARWLSH